MNVPKSILKKIILPYIDWNQYILIFIIENKLYDKSYDAIFQNNKPLIEKIANNLNYSIKIYPNPCQVFRAFDLGIDKIKVIIIGQDCYHNGQATGLCFSVQENSKIPLSLKNIYKELEYEGYNIVKNGDLSHWQNQGCLMLNMGLTVEHGNPKSHLKLWKRFIHEAIDYIAKNTKNVAWLLMGEHASNFEKYGLINNHAIFITSHPSPFSYKRSLKDHPAFYKSNVFKKINNFLGEKKIVW